MKSSRFVRFLLLGLVLAGTTTRAHAAWQAGGTPVCTAPLDQDFLHAVTDGAGGLLLAWQDHRANASTLGPDLYAQRLRSDGSASWVANGTKFATGIDGGSLNDLIPDGAGGAIAVWTAGHSSDVDVIAQRIDGAGNALWTPGGITVAGGLGGQFTPRVTSDGAGGALVVWREGGGTSNVSVAHVTSAGAIAWGPVTVGSGSGPVIASDGSGGAFVAYGSGGGTFVRRINSGGALAWSSVNVTSHSTYQAVIPDALGGAVVVWQESGAGAGNEVFRAQRVTAAGAIAWTAGGVLLYSPGGYAVSLVGDGSGGAFIVWNDTRNGTLDVFAHHVTSTGALDAAWPATGVAVCVQPALQDHPVACLDGAGGILLTWEDHRSGNSDVYAHHVLANGTVDGSWPGNGLGVCTAPNSQSPGGIVSDGQGGADLAWTDGRNGTDLDLYAQRISSTGALVAVEDPRRTSVVTLGARPNPARSNLVLSWAGVPAGPVTLEIFDAEGHRVRQLADRGRSDRNGSVGWDGQDLHGKPVPPGIYFARLRAGAVDVTRRVAVVR